MKTQKIKLARRENTFWNNWEYSQRKRAAPKPGNKTGINEFPIASLICFNRNEQIQNGTLLIDASCSGYKERNKYCEFD